jgi:hypothetical protein
MSKEYPFINVTSPTSAMIVRENGEQEEVKLADDEVQTNYFEDRSSSPRQIVAVITDDSELLTTVEQKFHEVGVEKVVGVDCQNPSTFFDSSAAGCDPMPVVPPESPRSPQNKGDYIDSQLILQACSPQSAYGINTTQPLLAGIAADICKFNLGSGERALIAIAAAGTGVMLFLGACLFVIKYRDKLRCLGGSEAQQLVPEEPQEGRCARFRRTISSFVCCRSQSAPIDDTAESAQGIDSNYGAASNNT